jgi:hypothetical protein
LLFVHTSTSPFLLVEKIEEKKLKEEGEKKSEKEI